MAENKGYTRTISTSDFTETPRLVLEQATGDAHVEGWDRPEIEVSVPEAGQMFDIEQVGSQVTVRNQPGSFKLVNFLDQLPGELEGLDIGLERVAAKVERKVERSVRRLGRGIGNINIDLGRWTGGRDYFIKAPHNCDVTLRTSSGDLSLQNVEGTLYVQSTSGDVKLANVAGNVLATSASGDISIDGVTGKLGVHTASGDVKANSASLQEVSVHTASGDITLDLRRLPERELEVKTVSGDLTVLLPSDARVSAEISTLSGDITCGFPRDKVSYGAGGRRNTSLTINGGGTAARIGSVSGDITIRPGRPGNGETSSAGAPTMDLSRSAGEGQPEAARVSESETPDTNSGDITESEGYAARQQAELEILQSLERGEMTSQEAMKRLSELGGE